MKIGILTLQKSNCNNGAKLQAYALQKTIEKLGHKAEVIDFEYMDFDYNYLYHKFVYGTFSEEKYNEFDKLFSHSNKQYNLSNLDEMAEQYDCFICGSDQVWACDGGGIAAEAWPVFALSFVPDNKTKIAYAASMGGIRLKTNEEEIMKSAISRIDHISVREQSAIQYLQDMSQKNVEGVLDPVLLLDINEWDQLIADAWCNCICDYVVYCAITKDTEFEHAAENFAKENNMEIVKIGYNDADNGPREFVKLIKNAKYVFTNSFHATVFSILYNVPFFTSGRNADETEYTNNWRMKDLLDKFGLQRHFSLNLNELNTINKLDFNWTYVKEVLEKNRTISLAFLKKSLKLKDIHNTNVIVDHKLCTGCQCCVNVCPEQCISLEKDFMGFLYPKINEDKCIECGKCFNCCPVNGEHTFNSYNTKLFSALNKNKETVKKSSSGGVFFALAEQIIKNKGVVFGAEYSEQFEVRHNYCDDISSLDRLVGSKYSQSNMELSYINIREFLECGKEVLFAGAPCQIAAIKHFLDKDYENLYCMDFICHGVTSQGLLDKYVRYLKNYGNPKKIRMKDKSVTVVGSGGNAIWFNTKVDYVNGESKIYGRYQDLFINLYLCDGLMRESCYNCCFKGGKSNSDITVGDFHGIAMLDKTHNLQKYNNGISTLFINSEKGEKLFNRCKEDFLLEQYDIEVIRDYNPSYYFSVKKPQNYEYIRSIFNNSSIERLFYENKRYADEQKYKNMINGESLFQKKKYISKILDLTDKVDVEIKQNESVIIYGAGTLGSALYRKINVNVRCFIDNYSPIQAIDSIPIYKVSSQQIKAITNKSTLIITTAVGIKESVAELFANNHNVRVIGIEELVL